MKQSKHTGFESYLTTHEFTKEFVNDYFYWSKRIFYRWKYLGVDFDTFYETCWEALLSRINEFDPGIATIQTFCISRINNEAWRFYMKCKSAKPEVDINNEVIENTLEQGMHEESLKASFNDFSLYCMNMGVKVNLDELYNDYLEGRESAPVIVYAWWKAKNKEVRGRYDISKRK